MRKNFGQPTISVVVLTFNSEKFVLETLESISNQTYENIELIVADDCSSDLTTTICTRWLEQNQSRFVSSQILKGSTNRGIPGNCNRGLTAATGDWIKFIAGDDALETNILTEYIECLHERPGAAAIFSRVQAYNAEFAPTHKVNIENNANAWFNSHEITADQQFNILLRLNCVSAPTVMLKRDVLKLLGGFNETFRLLEDWPLWLLLTRSGYKMHFLDAISIKYRIHANSVQRRQMKKYITDVELEVDRLFLNNYLSYLPFAERQARKLLIYRNLIVKHLFANKTNVCISLLSRGMGCLPFAVIKHCRKTFFEGYKDT